MFSVEIAGVPIGINNHYSEVETFCRDYITDRNPWFTVTVSVEDIVSMLHGKSSDFGTDLSSAGVIQEYSLSYAEELCIYRQIALAMIDYDAFLMHAAIIDVDGEGVAFAAGSGTGKSTRVSLWRKTFGTRVKVVNGDKPILRFVNDKLYAFGTPWMGKENWGANTRVPLKYVCFLEREEEVSLIQLETKQVLPRLFQQVLLPEDEEKTGSFMSLLDRFIGNCNFFLLKCNQDKENAEEIWEEMKKRKNGEICNTKISELE